VRIYMETINLTKQDIPSFKEFLADPDVKILDNTIKDSQRILTFNTDQQFVLSKDLYLELFPSKYQNDLIFGKDKTENIVSVEVEKDTLTIFKETAEGITTEVRPNTFWMVTHKNLSSKQKELDGDQYFKYLATFNTLSEYLEAKKKIYAGQYEHFKISDIVESALVFNGITYFKGMTIKDVSILSFDIEADGLRQHKKSEVYLITNTFRRQGKIEKKIFSLEDYESQGDMLLDWCEWVKEKNPSVITGHNVLSYDIPYLLHVAELSGVELSLGRNGSTPQVMKWSSQFRKDGSQSYEYNNIIIYGYQV
jgi:DNA polymerase I